MFYNRIPKPLPILFGLPDDPKPKFIWMKLGEEQQTMIQGRLTKRTFTSNPQQHFKSSKGNISYRTSIVNSDQLQGTQSVNNSTNIIYYEDFNIDVKESICKQNYIPIKNVSELQESLKNLKYRYDANHPRDYEIFGGFEGCNVQEIYYCKHDTVKIVLKSDTNSHGFCKWFSLGLKIYAFKELCIKVNIINLRALEKNRDVHVQRLSDNHEFFVPSHYSLTNIKRKDGYFAQCSFEIKSSYESYIISFQKPYSFHQLTENSQYGQLGLSKLLYPIYYWVHKQNGPLILIVARIRPIDANTSYLAEELIKQLKQTQLNVIVVPMLNPDGVVLGNSRCNLSGKDLSSNYQFTNPNLCPEIKSLLGIENVQIAIELRMHEKPHVVSSFKFNCGLPQRKRNLEIHDISSKYQKYVKIFISQNQVNYQELASFIIKALQSIQQQNTDNISYKSETDHEDDILDNFFYNPQTKEQTTRLQQPSYQINPQIQLQELLQTINPSIKEQESVNQLRNLEWKELTHRSELSHGKIKTQITPSKEIQNSFFDKQLIKRKSNYHQHSESHSQSQSDKIVLKSPFLPSREQIFEKYSNLSRSPSNKRKTLSQAKLQTLTQYQVFKYTRQR
ncbi:unnamed protein product [Paramecium primaurelia]|uniref:Peptidase M14 carboxypeptidase A domain-containing protein n=1 Tax=Paramecium primaurelia TaxID=5886 RepID=A0A8S1PZA6_PARPR|nr:unnamed protein product [Paramecium primaurelia]